MATRSNDPGAGRQPRNEMFDPGANYHGRFVVDEDDIDAAIGEHTLLVFAVTGDGLRPETQQIACQRWRRRVLAIIRSSCADIPTFIHGSNIRAPSPNRF